MGGILVERNNLAYDGNPCNTPTPEQEYSLFSFAGSAERESDRLSSFRKFPSSSSALPNRLAAAGYYYTFHGDVVKCFSCGQCVEHMTRNDNPRDSRFHGPQCAQVDGNDARNIPTSNPSTILSTMLSNLTAAVNNNNNQSAGTDPPLANPNPRPPTYPVSISPGPSRSPEATNANINREVQTTTRIAPAHPRPPAEVEHPAYPCEDPSHSHMRDHGARISTFARGWPRDQVIASPRDIAEAGFFYLGERDRVKCWYCNVGLENWECDDDPWEEHARWFPTCEFLLSKKGPDFVQGVVARFPNVNRPTSVPPGAIVTPSAPTTTSNVNIRPRNPPSSSSGHTANNNLQNVNINFPGMNISIRSSRIGSIVRTPAGNIRRHRPRLPPQIVDRQETAERHEQTVTEAMTNSPHVDRAREMGFSDEVIKMVLLSKCEETNRLFDDFEQMIESLMEYQAELQRAEHDVAPQTVPSTGGAASTYTQETGQPLTQAQEELRRLEEGRNCRVCHNERATVVLMPCAHLAICVNCAEPPIRICPVCKRLVQENIRSFLS